jgi:RNA recognition motif-containing protein
MIAMVGPAEIALYSLLWFAVGVAAGGAYARRSPAGAAKKEPQSGDKRSRRGERGSARTGASVELYVGNLPYDTSDKDLANAFDRFGRVLSVRMIDNKRSGKPKGFGFVEMENQSAADAAIKAMHGAAFRGRSLVVNEAKSRARRH